MASLWLAALGGCVGSFLNVVVYRLPAGLSIVHPSSRCPKCGHAIRWYDNVPVLGWLWLRGKCRDCHEPIAFRYPLVEALTATLFFGLAWVELFSDGANLPLLEIFTGLKQDHSNPVITTGQLVGVYVFHLLLLCTLLPAALIEYDKKRVPPRLFVPALLVGAIAPLIWLTLRPGIIYVNNFYPVFWVTDVFLHVVAGLVVGRILEWFVPWDSINSRTRSTPSGQDSRNHENRSRGSQEKFRNPAADGILLAMVCVSFFLDYEAVLLLGAVLMGLALLERFARLLCSNIPIIGPVIWLALLVPVWITFWRQLAEMCPLSS